ncbi:hypothetical protein RF11_09553 [Thelohanellus kitauei]|uniref:WDHD1/CFT4 second beta-propeller domain-containing protein n=1 Tax=Thelohanellus kitauei TaxID=669202 RepID=A0A0C2JHB8_THEKT|nr:hypothetical protein RF11_09553 [Thelohanellus kitauei]
MLDQGNLGTVEQFISYFTFEDISRLSKKRKTLDEDIIIEQPKIVEIVPPKPQTNVQLQNFQPMAIMGCDDYYLVWNSVGTVSRIRSGLNRRSLIKVVFHDNFVHSQIVLENNDDFVIGDLSETNVCLVSKHKDASDTKYFSSSE